MADAAIGDPSTPNTGGIELINKDGQTLTADGSWQKFTFNFGSDPVTNFSGGNGVLDGTRVSFEHLRCLNSSGTTDQVTMLVDDMVNTISGVDNLITGYDEFATGATATFLAPNFSGSTSTNLVAGGTSKVIDTAAHTGTKSYQTKFQFVDSSPTRYIRFTTAQSNTSNLEANPTIDVTAGNSFSFWLNATVPVQIIGWNTDADGNWSDASEWAGTATTGDNIPNTASEIARFLPTTAARTVTVDQDFVVNGINLNSPNAYTIAGTEKITLSAPANSGIDGSLTVQAGNHVITAPMAARARVAVSIPAGASLKTPGIVAEDSTGADASNTLGFVKTGAGSFETRYLRFDAVSVSGGTVKVSPDGTSAGTSEVNSLTFAGGTTPTAKLDIANNSLIVDWDTSAATPRNDALLSTRGRIINGYNSGDWAG